uniref:Disease resistance protein At4g27190-like leucine-rich repeats domain-containing protein n=1 Tax=Arundo donax TaxID=35708 RepID=A0A0A9HNF4_ARUDO
MHIQDLQMRRTKELPLGSEDTRTIITIPDVICDNAMILHVHDSLSITSIPGPSSALGSRWYNLRWCRVERCPMLDCLFTTPHIDSGRGSNEMIIFFWLRTLWTSQLPKACFIWNWSTPTSVQHFSNSSFEDLDFLHVDFCPRLIHVLPFHLLMINHSLCSLETLEIMWCGDLKEVFPVYTTDAESHNQQQHSTTTVEFLSLKHIHLHEVPKLQGICGRWRVSAPKLETVKIRGCWSLTRLPAVSMMKKVECDCEKEWWDRLQWDGLQANHHHSLYKPTHSRYYKKKLLRSSVLR